MTRAEAEDLVRADWRELVRLTLEGDLYEGERIRIDRRLCHVLDVQPGCFLNMANRLRRTYLEEEAFLVANASTPAIRRLYPPDPEDRAA